MQETDVQVLGSLACLLVDEAHALVLAFVQCGVGVVDGESNVVHTALAAVLLNERGNGALGASGLEKLDFHVAYLEKGGLDFLVCNLLNGSI